MKKKLEELNLLDNFLFGQMMTYPDTGKEFTRILGSSGITVGENHPHAQ